MLRTYFRTVEQAKVPGADNPALAKKTKKHDYNYLWTASSAKNLRGLIIAHSSFFVTSVYINKLINLFVRSLLFSHINTKKELFSSMQYRYAPPLANDTVLLISYLAMFRLSPGEAMAHKAQYC
jgi:hypothetical protein